MPSTLEKEFSDFLSKKRSPSDYGAESLIDEEAKSCMTKLDDTVPPEKNKFIKELNDIIKKVSKKYPNDGNAKRFQHEIIAFINDYNSRMRKGDDKVPKKFQVEAIEAASQFDKEGEIVGWLCDLFQGKYRTFDQKTRYSTASEIIHRIALSLMDDHS